MAKLKINVKGVDNVADTWVWAKGVADRGKDGGVLVKTPSSAICPPFSPLNLGPLRCLNPPWGGQLDLGKGP